MHVRPALSSRARDERGSILTIAAVTIPVFLLLTALVVDVGNWYTHKRQLQNKADAGALAAGVEYVARLKNCVSAPGTTGVAISEVAKRYAGIDDPANAIPGPEYNQTINMPSRLTVRINATSDTAADYSDGGNPCVDHTTGDDISTGGLWTDVKAREDQVGTIFGGFGLNLDHVTAQARVEVKPVVGIARAGLPFVAETGDVVECVWAEFVRARDGSNTGFSLTGGTANPVLLSRVGSSNTFEASIEGITFTNQHDDVAVRYWLGSTNGTTPCSFSDPKRVPLPENDLSLPNSEGTSGFRNAVADGDTVQGINWINVYDSGAAPGTAAPPKLRLFRLTPGSCGNPGFVTAASTCTIGFIAIVDDGGSPAPSRIIVQPSDPQIASASVLTSAASTTGDMTTYSGTITIDPGAQYSPTDRSQSYTQTGQTFFSVAWERNVGMVGSTNCAGPSGPCTGTFQGEAASGHADVQQATFVADPVTSTPLATAELLQSGSTPIVGSYSALTATEPFTIRLSVNSVLNEAFISLLRESVQGTGNRTRAIYCGNAPGSGAAALEEAIRSGCAKKLRMNQRADSCSPPPGSADNPWDCVQLEQGNKSAIVKGFSDRFTCTPNRWTSPASYPPEGDPRWAYIILTGFGRTIPAANNDWLPIEGLIRVYVTGWDNGSGQDSYEDCGGANDDPPRGYDGKGAQLWGHMVDIITTDDSVIVGDGECDLTKDTITCKPQLVR
jgi:Flp pilus assembly protein TadG